MNPLTADQVRALRALKKLWGSVPACLIGAGAVACHVARYWRQTNDLDISVSVSVDELPVWIAKLPGFRRHPQREHEWLGPGDVKLDILPAGQAALEAGEIVWPRSQARMSVIGFRLAFEQRQPIRIAPRLIWDVAPLSVLGLLKMVAYQDRPGERERDLEDLAHTMEHYLPAGDPRRFSEDVVAAGVDYHRTSAYVFGRELGALVNPAERAVVDAFLARVRNERDPAATQARMARLGPRVWGGEPVELLARIEAFLEGFTRQ